MSALPIKAAIAKLVSEKGYVTFPELQSNIEGTRGDQYISLPGNPNIWIWNGLSVEAADAIIELLEEKAIFVHPATEITKITYGGHLNIPEAKTVYEYKTPHWFVCVLHHSPYEGNA